MNIAQEMAAIAEEASTKNSHNYQTMLKIIKSTSERGEKELKLPVHPYGIAPLRKLLEKEGFKVTYQGNNDVLIKW